MKRYLILFFLCLLSFTVVAQESTVINNNKEKVYVFTYNNVKASRLNGKNVEARGVLGFYFNKDALYAAVTLNCNGQSFVITDLLQYYYSNSRRLCLIKNKNEKFWINVEMNDGNDKAIMVTMHDDNKKIYASITCENENLNRQLKNWLNRCYPRTNKGDDAVARAFKDFTAVSDNKSPQKQSQITEKSHVTENNRSSAGINAVSSVEFDGQFLCMTPSDLSLFSDDQFQYLNEEKVTVRVSLKNDGIVHLQVIDKGKKRVIDKSSTNLVRYENNRFFFIIQHSEKESFLFNLFRADGGKIVARIDSYVGGKRKDVWLIQPEADTEKIFRQFAMLAHESHTRFINQMIKTDPKSGEVLSKKQKQDLLLIEKDFPFTRKGKY